MVLTVRLSGDDSGRTEPSTTTDPLRPLRLLMVEDADDDAALIVRELAREGIAVTFERVFAGDTMRAALDRGPWDLVISDYSMPSFDALAALEILKRTGQDIPFIVVSGTIGEETAVAALRAGAHDFVVKSKLARLAPAVRRELREARLRSEQRRMREELMVADRMSSVGMLAASVAHEINNPLAAVLANLDFVRRSIDEHARADGAFVELMEATLDACAAAERVRQIVGDVRVFSRGGDDRDGPIDVHRVLDSTLRMAWNDIRHRARVIKRYGVLKNVRGTEARLGQVFLNLLVNAAQAIELGHVDENEIRVVTRMKGDSHVVIEISDTGAGIAPEVRSRLFSPFVSTKPPGDGTGLGLSICRRIVSELGGEISVSSEAGQGSSFQIVLPATDETLPETAPTVPSSSFSAAHRGRILVVDDEVMIASAIRRALGRVHDVSAALSADNALTRLLSGERFDLILCDLLMPEMTGMDLYRVLLERAPDQAERMVFMSGGAFTPEAAHFFSDRSRLRLDKPFDAAALTEIVNRCLDRPSRSAALW